MKVGILSHVPIPEGSDLIGKSIDQSGLVELDINVLTLYRRTTVIPNPRLKRNLEPGDRLLCFGWSELNDRELPIARAKPFISVFCNLKRQFSALIG